VLAASKGLAIDVAMDTRDIAATGDEGLVREMVMNLLDNAIRHTPPGGAIHITAAPDRSGTAAEVAVQDGCGGIPEGELDLVFETAYRGDAARTPGDGGAGLGLAVARGLVEAHDGHISVRNEGDGCLFTVRLPLA